MIQEAVTDHERKHLPLRGPQEQLGNQIMSSWDEDSISPIPNNIQYTASLCNFI